MYYSFTLIHHWHDCSFKACLAVRLCSCCCCCCKDSKAKNEMTHCFVIEDLRILIHLICHHFAIISFKSMSSCVWAPSLLLSFSLLIFKPNWCCCLRIIKVCQYRGEKGRGNHSSNFPRCKCLGPSIKIISKTFPHFLQKNCFLT